MAKHLNMEERVRLSELHAQLKSQGQMAAALGRHKSTISRELKRNRVKFAYCAVTAQTMAQKRRQERPLTPKIERPEILQIVQHGLQNFHSPDQIAGRMRRCNPDLRTRISAQASYVWIRTRPEPDYWRTFLRRHRRTKGRGKAGKIPRSVDISGRPAEANERRCLGHWEGDTLWGRERQGGLVTLVDRKSRYVLLAKSKDRTARRVRHKVQTLLFQVPPACRRSVTFDNGKEFAQHELLTKRLEMPVFFAEPYCPWQRGTGENTNGLIRQFVPKGTNFQHVSSSKINNIQQLLNHRPRKILNYQTPSEVFSTPPPVAIEI